MLQCDVTRVLHQVFWQVLTDEPLGPILINYITGTDSAHSSAHLKPAESMLLTNSFAIPESKVVSRKAPEKLCLSIVSEVVVSGVI